MNALSKREKSLLYFLLCFLLVVGGFYLVFSPLSKYYDNLQTKYGEVQMQQNMQRLAIAETNTTRAKITSAQESLDAQQTQFYPLMTNEDLNKKLAELVEVQHAMQITGIQMSDTKQQALSEFWSQRHLTQEQEKAKAAGTEAAKPSSLQVYTNTVTLSLVGTGDALIGLVDDILTRPAIRVTDVTLGTGDGVAFTLSLEVYMI